MSMWLLDHRQLRKCTSTPFVVCLLEPIHTHSPKRIDDTQPMNKVTENKISSARTCTHHRLTAVDRSRNTQKMHCSLGNHTQRQKPQTLISLFHTPRERSGITHKAQHSTAPNIGLHMMYTMCLSALLFPPSLIHTLARSPPSCGLLTFPTTAAAGGPWDTTGAGRDTGAAAPAAWRCLLTLRLSTHLTTTSKSNSSTRGTKLTDEAASMR
mmetsp:Transcript_24529/g.70784  ORF Transcript_24529/g.70784 Transcript_24529/m.70784 type:complete len:211 (+) Transcript_24529:623-1255(+)